MKRGHNIIAIDGVNGKDVRECGEFVKSVFVDADVEVAYFTFPNYSSETGKILARYIAEDIDLQPFVAHTLFALNRFEQNSEILSSSSGNQIAVIDRYWSSGYCYARASGLSDFDMATLQNIDMNLPFPNCMLIVDSPPNPDKNNRFEKDLNYLKKVSNGFKQSSKIYGWKTIERFEWEIPGQNNLRKILKKEFPTLLNSLV